MENGIEITGVLELQVFYECSSEGDRYGVIRCSLPFQYLLETEGLSGECEYPVMACVDQITVAIIDSREIDVKAVLYFKANVYQKWQERIVEQIQVQPADMERWQRFPGLPCTWCGMEKAFGISESGIMYRYQPSDRQTVFQRMR